MSETRAELAQRTKEMTEWVLKQPSDVPHEIRAQVEKLENDPATEIVGKLARIGQLLVAVKLEASLTELSKPEN